MAATPGNAVNESGASGLCNFDGTATFSTTALTQYYVLSGASANTVNNISPSTSGYVLTSNGASAQPTFQAVSAPSPTTTLNWFDDFIVSSSYNTTNLYISNYSWEFYDGTRGAPWLNASSGSTSHPGILTNTANGSTNPNHDQTLLMGGASQIGILLGGGALSISWCFNINTLSNATNRYDLFVGMYDRRAFTNGVFFQYNDSVNSGKWVLTAYASGATSTNSTTAVGTGWQTLRIDINAAGSSAEFFVNGTSIGTVSSGLPTGGIKPVISMQRAAGTVAADTLEVDAFWMTQTLTTPR
jgi:hypothetical protein